MWMWKNRSSSISRSSKGVLRQGGIYNPTIFHFTQFSSSTPNIIPAPIRSIRQFSIIRSGTKISKMGQDKAESGKAVLITSPELPLNNGYSQHNHHSRNFHMNHGNHQWTHSLATHTLSNGESTHKPRSEVPYTGQGHAELMGMYQDSLRSKVPVSGSSLILLRIRYHSIS